MKPLIILGLIVAVILVYIEKEWYFEQLKICSNFTKFHLLGFALAIMMIMVAILSVGIPKTIKIEIRGEGVFPTTVEFYLLLLVLLPIFVNVETYVFQHLPIKYLGLPGGLALVPVWTLLHYLQSPTLLTIVSASVMGVILVLIYKKYGFNATMQVHFGYDLLLIVIMIVTAMISMM